MKKKILIALIGNLVAFSAIAAPTFTGELSTATADVTVSKASELYLSLVDGLSIDSSKPLIEQRLFLFNLGSVSADTNISLAGANDTVLRSDGTIQSNPKGDGTSLTGIITGSGVAASHVTDNVAYFPESANKVNNDARALLFNGQQSYSLDIMGHSSTGLTVGEYVFDLAAQSYTE
ncbi:hypothetical protein RJE46_12225 [Cedecea neteri]|uniref:hypothetical protein n=1 Tax=Cedecea neteri TaxID=158822 RepID=UPI00289343DB|nr:hypothetical protein [Cedecea neteri]WNJ81950.1 hypothetical protein RJE46_12225 [Cedecea neteri]